MNEDKQEVTGASPVGDRAVAAAPSSPSVSPVPASIPSAWRRTMQMDWSVDGGVVMLTYPGDLSHIDIDDLEQLVAVATKGMRRRASAIEARRAETAQTGSVHESAGPEDDANNLPETPHE